jgi:hypothetical protein
LELQEIEQKFESMLSGYPPGWRISAFLVMQKAAPALWSGRLSRVIILTDFISC